MYSGLVRLMTPSSCSAAASSSLSRMRRPARSPPACMLVCPFQMTTVPSEKA